MLRLTGYGRANMATGEASRGRSGRASAAAERSNQPISQIADPETPGNVDVLALHAALEELAALDKRQADIVELRYSAGLTEAEVAAAIGVSPVTVRREIATARVARPSAALTRLC